MRRLIFQANERQLFICSKALAKIVHWHYGILNSQNGTQSHTTIEERKCYSYQPIVMFGLVNNYEKEVKEMPVSRDKMDEVIPKVEKTESEDDLITTVDL